VSGHFIVKSGQLAEPLAVLFACRYDDLRSAQDNIDLQSTILSRFDLIFIVKDPASSERDAAIASKVRLSSETPHALP
jgi:DNA replicative helicase MCM subunit Mcm2 (Cdc46/Mcm family)